MNTKKHWENRVEAALTPLQYTARDLSDGAACRRKFTWSHAFICTAPYPCSWTDFVLESWQCKDWLMFAKHFHSFVQGNV